MKAADIKKLYTKTKKAYEKRTGDKSTWVMNAKQQRLGTATVLAAAAYDYEAALESAQNYLADHEKDFAERKAYNLREAKKEAWKNENTPGWYFGKNDDFWQRHSTPEYFAQEKAEELKRRTERVERAKENLAKHGDFKASSKRAMQHALEMLNSPEVQSFLQQIGGTAEIQIGSTRDNCRFTEYHIRFHYRATEE